MFNFPHFEGEIGVDNTPTRIKVPKLNIDITKRYPSKNPEFRNYRQPSNNGAKCNIG